MTVLSAESIFRIVILSYEFMLKNYCYSISTFCSGGNSTKPTKKATASLYKNKINIDNMIYVDRLCFVFSDNYKN